MLGSDEFADPIVVRPVEPGGRQAPQAPRRGPGRPPRTDRGRAANVGVSIPMDLLDRLDAVSLRFQIRRSHLIAHAVRKLVDAVERGDATMPAQPLALPEST